MADLDRDLAYAFAAVGGGRGLVTSVAVDLDPSTTPTRAQLDSRITSLTDGLERRVEALAPALDHATARGLREDARAIRDRLEHGIDRSRLRGLSLAVCGTDGVWLEAGLRRPVRDETHVGRTARLAPLLPTLARDRTLVVAAASRDRGDVWRWRHGRLEPVVDAGRDGQGRHDQGGWSQARYQRTIDRDAHLHLRDLVDAIARALAPGSEQLLVLACAEDQRSELLGLLPSHLEEALIGWATVEAHAGAAALAEEGERLLEQRLAREGAALVDELTGELGRAGRAVAAWAPTLAAAWAGQVGTLLVDGRTADAWACPACGQASAGPGRCARDGRELEHEPGGGLDAALRGTLLHGGETRLVEEHGLARWDGVGALLRFDVRPPETRPPTAGART
ncbi:MAG: Vms1/Ankzf1 family peptidyl-tRNA hydrolase [Thermoleophilia bacterium]